MRCLALAIAFLCSSQVWGEDDKIRVLVVKILSPSQSVISNQVQYIEDYWASPGGIQIEVLNGSNPFSPTSLTASGTLESQLASVRGNPSVLAKRDDTAADVVLVFTGASGQGFCGYGPQENWTDYQGASLGFRDSADGTNDGLDLSGKDDFHLAIVSTSSNGNCNLTSKQRTALHELGHLLGGGHTKSAEGTYPGYYLNSDSHAHVRAVTIGSRTLVFMSILAEATPPDCSNIYDQACVPESVWSSSSGTNNYSTLADTASSVANYRRATVTSGGSGGSPGSGGSGGCSVQAPTTVSGLRLVACTSNFATQHTVTWADDCPSATVFYEVWYSQPIGQPYLPGWIVGAQNTPAFVWGEDALIKVKACSSPGVCSGLSSSAYLASYDC